MERKTQTGYLVLADISGYTSFVAKTEIEHAEKAISILLGNIIMKKQLNLVQMRKHHILQNFIN